MTAGFLFPAATAGAQPKPGFAERDVTPDIGMEKPGNYIKNYHHRFHDPCKVRVAVFDDRRKRVALVGVDALMVPRHLVLGARKEIQPRCGIGPDAILIAEFHSNTSGPTGMVQPGEYDFTSSLVKKLAYERSSCADTGYGNCTEFRQGLESRQMPYVAGFESRW
jgi:hypothetical protein